jgi:4-diphosphocytidyl-2-C-methyl-D-erythritol kinase
MNSITLNAPAKINLYLDVISRRRDSYHNIATIFCKTKLSDYITVCLMGKGVSVSCNHPALSNPRQNLAHKAACLMKKEFGLNTGISVHIKKNIPIAAGLGGGSSDAASVIFAINRLFSLDLKPRRLISIARLIGADVGFFLSGHNCAIGRGIGDKLERIDFGSSMNILLLVPKITIYTKYIYKQLSLRLTKPNVDVNMLARILMRKNWPDKLAHSLYNRLEDIVLPLYPITKEGKLSLLRFTDKVLLSGSGPSIFGIFNTRKEAEQAKAALGRDKRWELFLTKNMQ